MAKNKKTKKQKNNKKKIGFKAFIIFFFAILAAIIFTPTTTIILVGMLPTLVAYLVDNSLEKNKRPSSLQRWSTYTRERNFKNQTAFVKSWMKF